ncbi:MAG TPA: thioesterase family protein [Enteractinococcus helveticum]|uniref:Thioesterase family protein n=1 Tax=Enteractinococcus helveticum TaxID=1837282 RepID=A0A921FKJ1_9MICC|nr:thioesterase family protein [Enteractinococcus helveticum]HJF13699.1 thioesterase family protein [Enteractinococcus helveticum]
MTSSQELTQPQDTAYFRRIKPIEITEDVRTSYFVSTPHAQGAWQDDELHMAPVSGLVAAELEAYHPCQDFLTSRMSFDILGKLHAGEVKVVTETIRPGRTIELIQSTVYAQGRTVLVGRTWKIITSDTSRVANICDAHLPPVEDAQPWDEMSTRWPGGFIRSIHARKFPDHGPGHGRVWITSELDIIEGESTSSFAKLVGLADTANGLAPLAEPSEENVFFANVDLTIHFLRPPVGEWLGFAISANIGETGGGITSAILYDADGVLGRSEQSQTVRLTDA